MGSGVNAVMREKNRGGISRRQDSQSVCIIKMFRTTKPKHLHNNEESTMSKYLYYAGYAILQH